MVSIMSNASITNNIINKIDYSKILLEKREVELMEKVKESIQLISNIKKEYKEYTDVTEEVELSTFYLEIKFKKLIKKRKGSIESS